MYSAQAAQEAPKCAEVGESEAQKSSWVSAQGRNALTGGEYQMGVQGQNLEN